MEVESNIKKKLSIYRWEKESEGQEIHEKFFKEERLHREFGLIYFGYFKSEEAFAHFKLYGDTDVCCVPGGYCYKKYAKELFPEKFAFLNGHIFQR